MSDQFYAEIRIFPFNFAPTGWAMCDGQLLSISQNTALFSVLGTTYGGDGKSTFGLPNLQGNVAIHSDQYVGANAYPLGAPVGAETITLLASEIPAHSHTVMCDSGALDATLLSPGNAVPGNPSSKTIFSDTTTPDVAMNPLMVGASGGGQPHNNLQPYLVLNYCIALQGIYPPRS